MNEKNTRMNKEGCHTILKHVRKEHIGQQEHLLVLAVYSKHVMNLWFFFIKMFTIFLLFDYNEMRVVMAQLFYSLITA